MKFCKIFKKLKVGDIMPKDHKGHRERLRKKFAKNGADGLEQHELIELFLFYAFAQRNTNDIAHDLIDTFGSISSVFDASLEDLINVEWIGYNSAILLKLIPEVSRIYLLDKNDNRDKIMDTDSIRKMAINNFVGRTEEQLMLILLDIKMKLLFSGMISKGNSNFVDAYIQKIIKLASDYGASKAVLVHNHPSGIALPSSNDITTTIAIRQVLKIVNVSLLDHIIVADDDCVSMADTDLDGTIFR